MVTQKMISFKVDDYQLALFDELCADLGVKRNNLLNFLVLYANSMFKDYNKYLMIKSYASVFRDNK